MDTVVQPIGNFEDFNISFASQPAIRPTTTRGQGSSFSHKNGNSHLKYESVVPKNVYP